MVKLNHHEQRSKVIEHTQTHRGDRLIDMDHQSGRLNTPSNQSKYVDQQRIQVKVTNH